METNIKKNKINFKGKVVSLSVDRARLHGTLRP